MSGNYEKALQNDELSLKLRKANRNLYSAGVGCVIYAVWGVIELLLDLYYRYPKYWEKLQKMLADLTVGLEGTENADTLKIIFFGIVIVALVIFGITVLLFSGLQVYTGIAACLQSLGKKKRIAYIAFAFLFMFFEFVPLLASVSNLSRMFYGNGLQELYNMGLGDMENWDDFLVAIRYIFDYAMDDIAHILLTLTSIVILVELVIFAIRSKVLHKKWQKEVK